MATEKRIAKIESSFIGFEDHGLLTASLTFNYGGSGQSIAHRIFGAADETHEPEGWHRGHEMGMDFIRRLLLACGVNSWERIVGRTVLVTGDWSNVFVVEPLPTERGKAFDIAAWADEWNREMAGQDRGDTLSVIAHSQDDPEPERDDFPRDLRGGYDYWKAIAKRWGDKNDALEAQLAGAVEDLHEAAELLHAAVFVHFQPPVRGDMARRARALADKFIEERFPVREAESHG